MAVTTNAMMTRPEDASGPCGLRARRRWKRASRNLERRCARAKIDRQAENGAKLNHDRIHLPVCRSSGRCAAAPRKCTDGRCSTDGKKFREALDDSAAQQHDQVVAHCALRGAERFDHGVGVEAAQIVARDHPVRTIAMALPEGNGGFVRCCRFKLYPSNAALRQTLLRSRRSRAVPTPLRRRDSATSMVMMCPSAPSDSAMMNPQDCRRELHVALGDQAVGAGKRQIPLQRAARIGNAGRVAG